MIWKANAQVLEQLQLPVHSLVICMCDTINFFLILGGVRSKEKLFQEKRIHLAPSGHISYKENI